MAAKVTNLGKARLAAAMAGGDPLILSAGAVGDGNGSPITPDPAMTDLVRQVWSAPLSSVLPDSEDPSTLLLELVVPAAAGGWWIRELGILADDGALIVVADYPETYKPVLTEGVGVELRVVIPLPVSSAADVVLAVDSSAVITRAALDADLAALQGELEEEIAAHAGRADNPHGVTAGQVGAAPADHAHAIADVTDLQTALDGKSATGHDHDDRYYTESEVDTLLAGKSDTTHNHAAAYLGISAQAADSDKLDGMQPATAATASTIAQRDASGNLTATLFNGTATMARYA